MSSVPDTEFLLIQKTMLTKRIKGQYKNRDKILCIYASDYKFGQCTRHFQSNVQMTNKIKLLQCKPT